MVSHPHEVLLGPPRDLAAWPDEGSGAPAILQRSDDRFIEAVLAALRDPAGRIARSFGVRAFPTSFFVDGEGQIQAREVGYTSTLGLRGRLWLAR